MEASETKIDLAKYDSKLNRKINLLCEQNVNHLSKEFRNNLINGVVLYGFIKIQ